MRKSTWVWLSAVSLGVGSCGLWIYFSDIRLFHQCDKEFRLGIRKLQSIDIDQELAENIARRDFRAIATSDWGWRVPSSSASERNYWEFIQSHEARYGLRWMGGDDVCMCDAEAVYDQLTFRYAIAYNDRLFRYLDSLKSPPDPPE